MKIHNIISNLNSKENKQDISKIQNSLIKKMSVIDFDPQNIQKSDYFIHDFFLIKSQLFIVYKYQQYRVLLMVDITNQILIMIKLYAKKKNHDKYYNEFRDYAKKLVT